MMFYDVLWCSMVHVYVQILSKCKFLGIGFSTKIKKTCLSKGNNADTAMTAMMWCVQRWCNDASQGTGWVDWALWFCATSAAGLVSRGLAPWPSRSWDLGCQWSLQSEHPAVANRSRWWPKAAPRHHFLSGVQCQDPKTSTLQHTCNIHETETLGFCKQIWSNGDVSKPILLYLGWTSIYQLFGVH